MQRARGGSATAQKPSLVRSAIQHLLHRPAIALELPPPDHTPTRQPGIELLHELVLLVRERPRSAPAACSSISPAATDPRPCRNSPRRNSPARNPPCARSSSARSRLQLEKQVLQQRIDELQQRLSELDEAEKYELRALLRHGCNPSGSLRPRPEARSAIHGSHDRPGKIGLRGRDLLQRLVGRRPQRIPRRCCRCATGCRHGHRRCSRRNRPLSRRDRTPSPPPAWSPSSPTARSNPRPWLRCARGCPTCHRRCSRRNRPPSRRHQAPQPAPASAPGWPTATANSHR